MPSVLTYFFLQIKLNRIRAFTLHTTVSLLLSTLFLFVIDCSATTLYSVRKLKILLLLGFADQAWEEHIVEGMDGALNQFIDCVLDHCM